MKHMCRQNTQLLDQYDFKKYWPEVSKKLKNTGVNGGCSVSFSLPMCFYLYCDLYFLDGSFFSENMLVLVVQADLEHSTLPHPGVLSGCDGQCCGHGWETVTVSYPFCSPCKTLVCLPSPPLFFLLVFILFYLPGNLLVSHSGPSPSVEFLGRLMSILREAPLYVASCFSPVAFRVLSLDSGDSVLQYSWLCLN